MDELSGAISDAVLEYLKRYERRVGDRAARPAAETLPSERTPRPRSRCRWPASIFRIPIVLAAGTAAYGRELADIVDLDALGGLVTKAVSPEPRAARRRRASRSSTAG